MRESSFGLPEQWFLPPVATNKYLQRISVEDGMQWVRKQTQRFLVAFLAQDYIFLDALCHEWQSGT